MALVRILLVVCLAFMLPMCSGSVDQGDAGDGADVQDAGAADDGAAGDDANDGDRGPPPLLDSSHMGWKSQHCDLCHSFPRPGQRACPQLAGQHGILDTVQTWVDATDMESAIDSLLR